MMKFALAAILLAAPAGQAFAASGNSSTTTGASNATVVSPIVLTHTSGATLGFGKFTRGTGGTVVVSPSGAGSIIADVGFVPGSATSADAFTVTGDSNRSFAITTTFGSVSFGTGNSMTFATTSSAVSATTNNTGTASFTVGGSLNVSSTQASGSYAGTYNATVTYN